MQQSLSAETSMWVEFFKEASIPAQYVPTYAQKFAENRIRFDMLADLDRPLLNELGITAIGDCLSILKHAKIWKPKVVEVTELKQPKKIEVVKRVIGSHIANSPSTLEHDFDKNEKVVKVVKVVPKSAEKIEAAGNQSLSSNLSAQLKSRLNFNPSERVTSTTNDEETTFTEKKTMKRKLEEHMAGEGGSQRSVLEYQGMIKNPTENSTVIRVVNNNKRILSTNKKPFVKQTISMNPIVNVTKQVITQPAVVTKNLNLKSTFATRTIQATEAVKLTKKVASLRSDYMGKPLSERIELQKFEPPAATATGQSNITITLNNAKGSKVVKNQKPINLPTKFANNNNGRIRASLNQPNSVKSIVRQVNSQNGKDVFSRISL